MSGLFIFYWNAPFNFCVKKPASLPQVLAETTSGQTTSYLYAMGLVGQTRSGSTEYFMNDGLGTVRQVTNSSGVALPHHTPYSDSRIGLECSDNFSASQFETTQR